MCFKQFDYHSTREYISVLPSPLAAPVYYRFKMSKSSRCWHCRALGQDICKPGVTCQQWQLCQSFETHLQDPFTSHNPRKFCPHQSKKFYNCSALERSEKIKIVNCILQKDCDMVSNLVISEQFLEFWLEHFPTIKQVNKQKLKFSICTTRFGTTSQQWTSFVLYILW